MTHLKKLDNKPNHLVVIRISDSSATKQLTKKVRETCDMHPDIPGAKLLRSLGASPLRKPEKVGGRLTTGRGFRAVHFRIPGTKTWVLMALGSATMPNLGEDDNAFVALLGDTLSETPVHTLWVADFSRLLRSIDYFSHTWRAVREHCRQVKHAGAVIDTSSAGAEIQFLFEALSSAAEARFTVQRTMRGKMRAFVDGKCPLRNTSVPDGWTRNDAGRLQLDPSFPPEVIRTIVQVLGNTELTNEQRVKKVADAGGISRARSQQEKRKVRIDELNNPATTVARWYEALDAWRTGTWVVEHDLPTLLNQSKFDYDIELDKDDRGIRVWTMTFDMPAPDGGWATDDEFDAAIALRDRRASRETPTGGASTGANRKPFCGLPSWIHDRHEYKLLSRGAGMYELRRRPEEDATEVRGGRRVRAGWGRNTDMKGDVVAEVSAPELHRTVTEGLVDAATEGLTLQNAADQLLDQDDDHANDLRKQLKAARRIARNARRSANLAESEHERRTYQQDAREAAAEAQKLEHDLVLVGGSGSSNQLPVDAEAVAVALAAVADQPDHVDGDIADALREVVTDMQVTLVDDTTARWSASLRVPLTGGVLRIGPATGTLDLGLERQLAARRTKTLAERAEEAAELFMGEGLTIDETSSRLRISTTRRVEQAIRDHLMDIGAAAPAARALVAWAPPAARRVVWARLAGTPYPTDVPQAYAAHVADTYLDTDVRQDASIDRTSRMPKAAVAAVLDRGGWVSNDNLNGLCEAAGISMTTLTYYVDGRVRNGREIHNYLRRFDGGVGLIPCPHDDCDGWATIVSMLPEIPRELLCGTCRRMPDTAAAGIVFPKEYLAAT